MNNGILRFTAIAVTFLLLFAACGRAPGKIREDPDVIGQASLNIVTSFYPIYISAINVTRDVPGVSVTNMTKPQTGCLHEYSLKPEDLKILEKADIFIINGAGMEAFLDDVTRRRENLEVIEASRGIPLLADDNGEENPHAWVSVSHAIDYIKNIAEQLSALDAANAELYNKNSETYIKKLTALKVEMHSELDALENRDIITFHEAFPYFAKEFDLKIAAVVESEPGTEPTPKELAEMIDMIRRTGISALFAEPQYSSSAARTIARETGASVYTLDPVVTGEAGPDAYDAYIDIMRQNKQTLAEALG